MKKFLMFLCTVTLVFGLFGSASAVPVTWTDMIDFNPDVSVPPTLSYFHDISDDGFSTIATGGNDTISGFNLSIELYDDNAGVAVFGLVRHGFLDWRYEQTGTTPDGTERAFVNVALLDWNWFDIDGNAVVVDGSLAGGVDIWEDGTLNVSIAANLGGFGDFMVDSSYLEVYGDDGTTAPVPEPATLFLMGLGLIGIVGIRRRKNS